VLVNAAEQIPDSANVNIFGTGALSMNGVNETIGSLTMTAGGVFNGGSAALILGGGVTTLGTTSQINSNVNLGGATRTFDITDSASANDAVVNGVISNGTLLKTGAGTLMLTGNFSNTHGATTVVAGTLVLQKTFEGPIAAPGNVTVGDGSTAATLRISQSEQIGNAATLSVNNLGTVELPVHQETIGGLAMTGNAQITGGGLVVLQGNVTTNAAANSATIAPRIDLGGALRSFTIADGAAAADLSVSNELTNGSVGKFGPGRMDIKRVRDVDSITVIEGTVRMMDDPSDAGVSVVNSLGYSGSGKIDLRNTRLVARASGLGGFSGGSYTGMLGVIQSGRNGGTWDGGGVVTSMTDAQPATALTSLGAATAAQAGRVGQVWGGATLVAGDVLVMYTYAGDANLDGKINIDDYGRIDGNVASSGSVFGWFNGDFNYDGKINIDDYGIIDGNINRQGTPFAAAGGLEEVSAVPEPVLSLWLAPALLARRRRRSG
jgi:autotransporter-associated beta strand protein